MKIDFSDIEKTLRKLEQSVQNSNTPYSIRKSIHGYAVAVKQDTQDVLHLVEGSEINEKNVKRIVNILNTIHQERKTRTRKKKE